MEISIPQDLIQAVYHFVQVVEIADLAIVSLYILYNQLQLVTIAPAVSNVAIVNASISVVCTLHFYMHAVCSFIAIANFFTLLLHGLALPVCVSEKFLVQYDSLHWASFDSCSSLDRRTSQIQLIRFSHPFSQLDSGRRERLHLRHKHDVKQTSVWQKVYL